MIVYVPTYEPYVGIAPKSISGTHVVYNQTSLFKSLDY